MDCCGNMINLRAESDCFSTTQLICRSLRPLCPLAANQCDSSAGRVFDVRLTEHILLDPVSWRAEVDQQAVLHSRRLEVSKNLSDVFVASRSDGLQLDDQLSLYDQVREVLAERRAVFIQLCQRVLLLNMQASFAKSVCQPVLVDFLQMAVTVVAMKFVSGLPDDVAELHDGLHDEPRGGWPRKGAEDAKSGVSMRSRLP